MKTHVAVTLTTLLVISAFAADSDPKQEVTDAAKKLGQKANYSWTTTVVVPEGTRFRPGPTEGKTEKDGVTEVSMKFGENTTRAILQGDKAVVSNPEGEWQSTADLENEEGPGRFRAMFVRNIKTPAAQAAEIAGFAKDLKKDGDGYASDLTEDGAKTLLTFRARRTGEGPSVSNAKGSVKFWVKDGLLSKYEYKVKGTVSYNGNDFENDRTTTVEIKEIGTTKIQVPEEAKKKLS